MTVDKTSIFVGEEVHFAFVLKNTGDDNVTFWKGPPFFDIYLYNLNGALVAKYTGGRAFAAYVMKITLEPGETFSLAIEWDLYAYHQETGGFIPVKPGQYSSSGVWLGDPRVATSMIGITVEEPSDTQPDATRFAAVVNEMESLDVYVCVNISDGLTEKEAELIVGTTFIVVMGDSVTHRLDTLTFDDTQIEAHYTWGHDENDMGHVFDVAANVTTRLITVSHCF